ncbi:MAG: alpha/beta hydrolase [Flavobacteriaceae bacterium]|jgi:acetyl esterase|nr:alpha/beta hydrolase [Flavobacteriaceae bacterium]
MILPEQIPFVLEYIQNIKLPNDITSIQEQGRAFYELFTPLAGTKQDVHQIQDLTITTHGTTIPIRIYKPIANDSSPVIIFFHGGWFNAGSLNTHDTPLRQFANLTQATIISVDYKLAPEHPFPAGLHDAEYATAWIINNAKTLNINPHHITIAGDSAGAAIATTVTRKFRTQVCAQLLIYPVTDNSLTTSSWQEYKHGPLLNLEEAIIAWDWYLPTVTDKKNQDAIPLLANDLTNLPPTFIAIAEFDPLKDEAILYADKLRTYNVSTKLNLYPNTIHGFFQMGAYFDQTNTLMQDMTAFLQQNKAL